ncbi:MAG: hypothetical protein EHM53_07835 [Methanoregulaceae archaeon]|nr:MAG: hypothetical protein EHM53_07835 [Methanoregulaceae archaeon]
MNKGITVTGVVFHNIQRTAWHQVRHTCLADVGTAIDVPLTEVSNPFGDCILAPPCPRTRYFEIEIDEVREGSKKDRSVPEYFSWGETKTGLAIPEIPD